MTRAKHDRYVKVDQPKIKGVHGEWPQFSSRPISWQGEGFYRLVWPDGEPYDKVWVKIDEDYASVTYAFKSDYTTPEWVEEESIY